MIHGLAARCWTNSAAPPVWADRYAQGTQRFTAAEEVEAGSRPCPAHAVALASRGASSLSSRSSGRGRQEGKVALARGSTRNAAA